MLELQIVVGLLIALGGEAVLISTTMYIIGTNDCMSDTVLVTIYDGICCRLEHW
mgnify:FL=1